MQRHVRFLGAAALAAGLALAGCGSDSKPSGSATTTATSGPASTAKVSADAWAGSVCTSVGTWVTNVQAMADDFTSTVSSVTDAAAAKEQLRTFADKIIAETDTMLQGVRAAGVPDVANGDTIAQTLTTSLASIKPIFEQLKTGIAALPTGNAAAFVAAATALGTTLTKGLDTFSNSLGELSSGELKQAFQNNPSCAALTD